MLNFEKSIPWLIVGIMLLVTSIVYFIISLKEESKIDWGTVAVFFISILLIKLSLSKKDNIEENKEE